MAVNVVSFLQLNLRNVGPGFKLYRATICYYMVVYWLGFVGSLINDIIAAPIWPRQELQTILAASTHNSSYTIRNYTVITGISFLVLYIHFISYRARYTTVWS